MFCKRWLGCVLAAAMTAGSSAPVWSGTKQLSNEEVQNSGQIDGKLRTGEPQTLRELQQVSQLTGQLHRELKAYLADETARERQRQKDSQALVSRTNAQYRFEDKYLSGE